MSGYSGNIAKNFRSNPYFEGVISPITTQGEVTINVRVDRLEVSQRNKNATSKDVLSYPGGDNADNIAIMPHETIFGWKDKNLSYPQLGGEAQRGFSSLNGINYGVYDTDEELMDNLYFIGVAKTPFVFDSTDQLQHGFSAIGAGSCTTHYTGFEEVYPGDAIQWSVVPRPSAINPNFPNGEYGGPSPLEEVGGRQGYNRYGTPRGKYRFILSPIKRGDMRPGMNGAISKMLKNMSRGGVADMPISALISRRGGRYNLNPTPSQEYAKATLVTDLVCFARIAEVLIKSGDITVNDENARPQNQRPNQALDLLKRVGLFDENVETPPQKLRDIIDNLYLGYPANFSASSQRKMDDLRINYPTGFNASTTAPANNDTPEAVFVKIAMDYANFRQGAYDRAVHHKERRRIGRALSYASKGSALDILLDL